MRIICIIFCLIFSLYAKDYDKSNFSSVINACKNNNSDACILAIRLGLHINKPFVVKGMSKNLCDKDNSGYACAFYSHISFSYFDELSYQTSLEYDKKACDLGYISSCISLAIVDKAKYSEEGKKAFILASENSLHKAALLFNAISCDGDIEQATLICENLCKSGDLKSCMGCKDYYIIDDDDLLKIALKNTDKNCEKDVEKCIYLYHAYGRIEDIDNRVKILIKLCEKGDYMHCNSNNNIDEKYLKKYEKELRKAIYKGCKINKLLCNEFPFQKGFWSK